MLDAAANTTATEGEVARRPAFRRFVPLLMLMVALGHFNRIGMSVAGAERIIPDYQLPPAEMGKVYSTFLLCYTLAMLPGGWLIDRFGPRRMLMAYGFSSAVLVALTGCVGLAFQGGRQVWLGLMIVRSVLGLVNAPLHPSSARMVHQYVPVGARSSVNGAVVMAACLGIAVTYYGLGELIDLAGWPIAFVICGGATLAAAVVWTLGTRGLMEASPKTRLSVDARRRSPGLLETLSRRSVICITLSYAALGYFQYLFFYWIEYYFEAVQKQGVHVGRQYNTLIVLMMGAGMACGGWATDRAAFQSPRLRRSLLPSLGLLTSAVVFELGLLAADPRLTLAAFAAAAALLGTSEGAYWTTIAELGGRHGGTACGLMNTGGNVGGTLSPYLTPLLGAYFASIFDDDVGWRMSLAVAGAVSLLGAVLWWGVDPAHCQDADLDQGASLADHAD